MVKPSKEGLLKQRKSLEFALRELTSGKFRATPRGIYRATAQMGGPPLDTTEHRIASVEKRIVEIDDRIERGDHA